MYSHLSGGVDGFALYLLLICISLLLLVIDRSGLVLFCTLMAVSWLSSCMCETDVGL